MKARFVAGSTMIETTACTTARPKKTEAVTACVSSSTKAETASAAMNARFVAASHGRATRNRGNCGTRHGKPLRYANQRGTATELSTDTNNGGNCSIVGQPGQPERLVNVQTVEQ